MARIELVNLRKTYGHIVAVRELNCVIEDGEFVVFVGPSGCGKTTTLRLIAGFEEPDQGEIRIDGKVVNDLEPRDRGLGMVFQTHALFPHKTVAQNIEFGLRMKKVPRGERARRVREVAAMVRLTVSSTNFPVPARVGIAARRAGPHPGDEPVDLSARRAAVESRRQVAPRIARRMRPAASGAEKDLHLRHARPGRGDDPGRPHRRDARRRHRAVGSPMEIYSDPVTDFVADFFGSPSMNLIAGEVVGDNGAPSFRSPQFSIALPEAFRNAAGPVTLGIRPEHFASSGGPAPAISSCRSGSSSRWGRIRCSISTSARSGR